ncbi:hypothetical protein DdX_00103 [Ditylenchus destructor]|uniref:Uncharacterized protein n=1 Tax=Ditylenchus destructor TaxID=166010 RepID=A0AAD4NJY6_9BILA|nr:hypothetical protein DdX_00103 [Ditylenchus destructor]
MNSLILRTIVLVTGILLVECLNDLPPNTKDLINEEIAAVKAVQIQNDPPVKKAVDHIVNMLEESNNNGSGLKTRMLDVYNYLYNNTAEPLTVGQQQQVVNALLVSQDVDKRNNVSVTVTDKDAE